MFELIGYHTDVAHWVNTLGYLGLFAIIFLETGVFACFFFPGDSLVFTAGILASRGIFDIRILIPCLILAAILGYILGYWFGDKLGHWLMKRTDTFYFKKKYITQAHLFYEKHGGKALVLGRLVPVVRTFVPIVAGMVEMPYKHYSLFNILGGFVWAGGVTLLGYYLGSIFPNANHFILLISAAIIVISITPALWHYWKRRKQ